MEKIDKDLKNNKNFRLNKNYKTIVASSLICGTLLLGACQSSENKTISTDVNEVKHEYETGKFNQTIPHSSGEKTDPTESTNVLETDISTTSEVVGDTTMNAIDESDLYSDIEWESSVDGRMFAAYLKSMYDIDYVLFIARHGYTGVLEQYLAEYYNSKKGTDYTTIPFSSINYDKAYRISQYGQNYGFYYNESDKEFYKSFSNELFFSDLYYFSSGLFDVPDAYLYDIMKSSSIDTIYPDEEIQYYSTNTIKNMDETKEMRNKYYNIKGSFSDNLDLFAYYLSCINSVNVELYTNFKILTLNNDGSQEYSEKVQYMNNMFHEHFLNKYGIDYEFHVDQPLDESFIDDVLIPAFGEEKVKEAQESIIRLQTEVPQKEAQSARSR